MRGEQGWRRDGNGGERCADGRLHLLAAAAECGAHDAIQFVGLVASAGRTIASYSWDFGDGGSSTLASPSHTYAAGASYNVTLTVTDSAGKIGRVTKTVQVQ